MTTRTSTKRRRRWIVRTVVILIAAVAASLLSAWIPAAIKGWQAVRNTPAGIVCESTPPGESRPRTLFSWTAPAQQRWRTEAPYQAAVNGAASLVDSDADSVIINGRKRVTWPQFLPVPDEKPGFEICSDAFGWPWMCMHRVTTFQTMPNNSVYVDFRPGREVWMFQVDQKWYMIPLRPIWRGFVGNAVVFAAIIGVMWTFPGVIRRARRRGAGRCVSCGYSLAGSSTEKCPECGAAVEARAVGG